MSQLLQLQHLGKSLSQLQPGWVSPRATSARSHDAEKWRNEDEQPRSNLREEFCVLVTDSVAGLWLSQSPLIRRRGRRGGMEGRKGTGGGGERDGFLLSLLHSRNSLKSPTWAEVKACERSGGSPTLLPAFWSLQRSHFYHFWMLAVFAHPSSLSTCKRQPLQIVKSPNRYPIRGKISSRCMTSAILLKRPAVNLWTVTISGK